MVAVKAVTKSLDEVPEVLRGNFVQRDGQFVLSKFDNVFVEVDGEKQPISIDGFKTSLDVQKLSNALEGEKQDREKRRTRFGELWELGEDGLAEVRNKLSEYEELKIKAEQAGKLNEDQLEKVVNARLARQLTPIQSELKEKADKLNEALTMLDQLQTEKRGRLIQDAVRGVKNEVKYHDLAEEDILLNAERMLEVDADGNVVTRDAVGVTPGVDAKQWLIEMQVKRPLWWPDSVGGGAKGSKAQGGISNNPWSKANWNITAQGQYVREHGKTKAEAAAKSVGSYLGAVAPAA